MENDTKYTDDYEKRAVELVKKLTKNNFEQNAIIFREAADQIIKSANPDVQDIYNFFLGMSKQHEAKSQKEPSKALPLLDEALQYLSKCNWDDKISNEYIETKILKLNKQVEINKKNFPKLTELFYEIANEEKRVGDEKSSNMYMGLYHLHNGLSNIDQNPVKAMKEMSLSANSFEKTNNPYFKHKILGIRHRLLAYYQPTYKARIELLEKALKEFEQTEDHFGINEVRGSICYVSAQSEQDPAKKVALFKDAAEYYRKDKLLKNYHDAIGWANLWESHKQPINLNKSITFIKNAQKHFKKADNPRDFHNSSGFLFLLKVIKGENKKFGENLIRANQHFAKSKNLRYLNFTAGAGLLFEAPQLPDEKAKDVFKKAAEILQTINENTSHLAYYHYYRIEAYKNLEDVDYREDCLSKAITHLNAWLDNLKFDPNTNLPIPPNFSILLKFYKAETLFLKGMIGKNLSNRRAYLKSAIVIYDEIVSANFWPERALRAKGWMLMYLFEFDNAHEAFSAAYKINPKNTGIQKDIEYATEQLKKGFHDLKQMHLKERNASRELQKFLANNFDQSSHLPIYDMEDCPGQNFSQQAICYLQKAGLAIEENYPQHTNKNEEGLRDEMIQCLKMFNVNVSAESKKAKGKRDIVIKDNCSNKELTAECLIWNGIKYYDSKIDQLFNRYLTWHDKEASLVTFFRENDFAKLSNSAIDEIKQSSSMVPGSFQDMSHESCKLYVSEHVHKSGTTIRLYHIFLHLPIDN
jgi:hypothetical protein